MTDWLIDWVSEYRGWLWLWLNETQKIIFKSLTGFWVFYSCLCFYKLFFSFDSCEHVWGRSSRQRRNVFSNENNKNPFEFWQCLWKSHLNWWRLDSVSWQAFKILSIVGILKIKNRKKTLSNAIPGDHFCFSWLGE